MGDFRQRGRHDKVWRDTLYRVFLYCKYFRKLMHRCRKEGRQDTRLKRKPGASSEG